MSNYESQYKEIFDKYEQMVDKFHKTVESQEYHDASVSASFDFLNALRLCRILKSFAKNPKENTVSFAHVDAVVVFYRDLIHFKKIAPFVLEKAACINQVGKMADEINEFVTSTPYLGKAFSVYFDEDVLKWARECLEEIPKYPDLLTKEFRYSFLQSVIATLPREDLDILVAKKIIGANDINNIAIVSANENYIGKINYLCELLGHPRPVAEQHELKLVGVTFPNDDGTSRQENIVEMRKYMDSHPDEPILLDAEKYTYVPEIGDPEPAIKISWNGKCIGNLAKGVARDIDMRYVNPQFKAYLVSITGGNDGMNIGCKIHLGIIAPEYTKTAEEAKER